MADAKSLISILLLSIDRYDTLKRTLVYNLENVGHDYELLVCDNGSTDARVIDFLESIKPTYFRKNKINEGCGRSFNQLFLRAKGSHIALMSNDILWCKNWGQEMVSWSDKVPDSGLVGLKFRGDGSHPPLSEKHGHKAHFVTKDGHPDYSRIFGPTLFRREVVDKIGLFAEDFGPYSLEDSNFNERVSFCGFDSFYIPSLRSEHLIEDSGTKSEYRKMKDASMQANDAIYNRKRIEMAETKNYVESLPPMRDPL